MSLNWKEIGLILEEADLTGSKIQSVIQNSFHSVTWQLYKPERGRFDFYTEVGTQNSRINLVSEGIRPKKMKKLQRFEQFARKNIEGSVIKNCSQMPFDRLVRWDLDNHGRNLVIWLRLYSASGANIIVTDENGKILDLMLRRPGRDEISGSHFVPEVRTQDPGKFEIRDYEGSFNSFIESYYNQAQREESLEELRTRAQKQKDRELSRLEGSIISASRSVEANSNWEDLKNQADLLSAVSYSIPKGSDTMELTDWNSGKVFSVKLNPSLSAGDNVQAFYDRYQKAKGTWKNACEELEKLRDQYRKLEKRYEDALTVTDDPESDLRRLRNLLEKKEEITAPVQNHPGLHVQIAGWNIMVGRNAKENDELLRHFAKPNDMWFHTRDFPGGYVFVRYRKEKTIPLEVMLDAANLAAFYSKGRENPSVDLYYTQVRYLRRAKNGKTGLVLPTQEKNLTIKTNPQRAKLLLEGQENDL